MGLLTPEELHARYLALAQKQPPVLEPRVLDGYIQRFLDQTPVFEKAAGGRSTPLYVVDHQSLVGSYQRFTDVFESRLPRFQAFYALKSNSHPAIAGKLVEMGAGLDVSSGIELQTALDFDCRKIIFSGLGKTEAELDLALANADRVTVFMDSFGELDRLERGANSRRARIKAGVRLTTLEHGVWRKFGIPLARLNDFIEKAQDCAWIDLCGLQFHTSWNLRPEAQVAFIARLGDWFRENSAVFGDGLRFLDIGGGYWPEDGEWLRHEATDLGQVHKALGLDAGHDIRHRAAAAPLETFARDISQSLRRRIPVFGNLTIYAEPGRWLCHGTMHFLVRVLDKKAPDLVITDGGIHMAGWERYENDFAPVINLSRPSTKEQPCLVCGSLCTPHDVWGTSYFGAGMEEGDLLLIPDQGAYTYSLRQNFIKPEAATVIL